MAMDKTEVHEKLLAIYRKVLHNPELEIKDEHTFMEITDYDSLAYIQILVKSQKVFGVSFTAMEAGQMENFGILKKLIYHKILEQT